MAHRPRPAVWILLALLALALVGQAVPLYTDWLWFQEVGFAQVFTTILVVRGWLVLGLGAAVFVFLFANLWVAARTAPPDVLWELEDQLGLPGRAVLEPLVRRLLVPVISVIALMSGARASGEWDCEEIIRNEQRYREFACSGSLDGSAPPYSSKSARVEITWNWNSDDMEHDLILRIHRPPSALFLR